jgi:hypothetical protein
VSQPEPRKGTIPTDADGWPIPNPTARPDCVKCKGSGIIQSFERTDFGDLIDCECVSSVEIETRELLLRRNENGGITLEGEDLELVVTRITEKMTKALNGLRAKIGDSIHATWTGTLNYVSDDCIVITEKK